MASKAKEAAVAPCEGCGLSIRTEKQPDGLFVALASPDGHDHYRWLVPTEQLGEVFELIRQRAPCAQAMCAKRIAYANGKVTLA